MTTWGQLELKKTHVLCKGTSKYGISQRVQDLMCHVGQSVVYEEGSELFEKLMQLSICGIQIQRVCNYYGSAMDPLIKSDCTAVIPELEKVAADEPVYVMVDGCLLYTRDDQWRELKLARMFSKSRVVDIQADRREIMDSVYVSHLGSVDDFFPKLERHLVPYKHKVIIGDGAKWIWNWAEDNYPGALQILDFYHAKEKLVLFANAQLTQAALRSDWVSTQCEKLQANQLEEVIKTVSNYRARTKEAKEAKQKLIAYYRQHEDRMQYKTYRDKGLMIGSGPIEAAHRSVIQQRLKLSGQKWSIKGAQAIANLRCYKKSGAWDMVNKVIRAAA